MSKVSLTLEGDDWADIGLQLQAALERLGQPTATTAPQREPTPLPVATGPIVDGPPGECPKHMKPWKDGKYGPYCTAKDETGKNGYCSITPGDIWNGKRAVA